MTKHADVQQASDSTVPSKTEDSSGAAATLGHPNWRDRMSDRFTVSLLIGLAVVCIVIVFWMQRGGPA